MQFEMLERDLTAPNFTVSLTVKQSHLFIFMHSSGCSVVASGHAKA